jgi:RNA polymerase sigma-70 factor (ECF subfamily)
LEKQLNKIQGMLDKSAQYTNTDDEKLFSFIEKGDKGALHRLMTDIISCYMY